MTSRAGVLRHAQRQRLPPQLDRLAQERRIARVRKARDPELHARHRAFQVAPRPEREHAAPDPDGPVEDAPVAHVHVVLAE
jgi:hypothetical protein